MLRVYLAGEIHSNWREEIIQFCEEEKFDGVFTYEDLFLLQNL